MFANERQQKIHEMIHTDGAVTTSGLVNLFDVSIETIRRDLLCMEKDGLLKRVHGGAIAVGEMKVFNTLTQRNKEHGDLKQEIALTALPFVEEGDYIFIDSGSTAIPFAEMIRDHVSTLTVVTHSLDVFQILHNHRNISVILCGGYYDNSENAFYGALTLDMLEKLHVQKAFIFPSAVSIEFGLCDYLQNFYMVQKLMIKNSDSVYILADSSKFEKRALLKMDDMRSEYHYVTDHLLTDELRKLYKENGIHIAVGKASK